ncbi:hypothetical protein SCA6_004327, partial [Theobroma cacao]
MRDDVTKIQTIVSREKEEKRSQACRALPTDYVHAYDIWGISYYRLSTLHRIASLVNLTL